jgi:ferredoxin
MMAYKISDACVNCGACEAECSSNAISEKDGKRWIDPDKCVDCGGCTAACPVEAIAQ